MEELIYPFLVFGAGVLSGIINVMAGGGSVITLGVLILLGMDPSVANGTNRIGLVVETGSGVLAFKSEKYSEAKTSLGFAILTVPGAMLGSYYAIKISDIWFQRILAMVMIFVLISLLLPKPAAKNGEQQGRMGRIMIYPAMFGIGLYGGFIQAGVGFLIMAALRHLLHLDLVRINMHKVFIVLVYTIPVIFIFGFTGNINWLTALYMAGGYALGAWWSAKISIAKGEKVVKIVLCIAILIMATKFILTI